MRRIIFAGLGIVGLTLTAACGGSNARSQVSSSAPIISATASQAPSSGVRFANATAVAKALDCRVRPISEQMAPGMTSLVGCEMPVSGQDQTQQQMFTSLVFVATFASSSDEQQAKARQDSAGSDAYAGEPSGEVWGNGWMVSCPDRPDACQAAQHKIGGTYVPRNGASAPAQAGSSAGPSDSGGMPTIGVQGCNTSPPGGHDAAWNLVWQGACDLYESGPGPQNEPVAGWCRIYASDAPESGITDSLASLMQACKAGIKAAGGP